ncbi:MAG TPA: pyridoxal phosphate-dependent aminotransferase [Sandaracinaceae bacterium LLY-WYZ-13_1]|nr:pyridoxal phosphate-dependent aminotransferase [Sandaracinaceae bacterium LLY-WYZ-13_1]
MLTGHGPFSGRSDTAREVNALTAALDARRARGAPVIDLTVSNPTVAGLPYDAEGIGAALADPAALSYEPHPLGLPAARRAIAAALAEEGVHMDPARVLLTASTSEAYAHLFALLCDPGDEVLVPEPSYPLLEHLAHHAGVHLARYPLTYDGRWHADPAALFDAIGERTRALVAVSPNNPTGSYATRDELEALAALGLPLIVDEVFHPYALAAAPKDRARAATLDGRLGEALVFALDGLSKRAALPQLKLAWTTVSGPDALVEEALARLEVMADTFLSPNTPAQVGLEALLAATEPTRAALTARLEDHLAKLRAACEGTALTVPRVEGGWYAPVRLPATETDERWALSLLDAGLWVQPGYFYDFPPDESWIVVSLMTPPAPFAEGLAILAREVDVR